jgi:hypothetical protein
LEDSFEVVFYLTNQYLSESINKDNSLKEKFKDSSDNLVFDYKIDYEKYLFINEEIDSLKIYKNEKDNFLQDLIDNKRIEIIKIQNQLNKLSDGKIKNNLGAKKNKLYTEKKKYLDLLKGQPLITKEEALDKSNKILKRYKKLKYQRGTMTKALSKLIKNKNSKLSNSFDLLTFKIYEQEKQFINKSLTKIDPIYTNFYKHTNKLSEIYFTFGKYADENEVLEFSIELLEFMTEHFIIFPYIMILKKTLYAYFESTHSTLKFIEINEYVNYSMNFEFLYGDKIKSLEDHLYKLAPKIVQNSIMKFKNSDDELEFVSENISDIFGNIVELFKNNPVTPIPEEAKFYTVMKEVNGYFDTFVPRTITNWLVVIENTFKFNINHGRIVRSIEKLIS